jgi:DNA-binding beta-propeller fold protein YncE
MDRGGTIGIFDDKGVLKNTVKMGDLAPNSARPPSAGGISCGPDNWYIADNNLGQFYIMEYGKNKLVKIWGSQGTEPNQFTAPNKSFYFPDQKALVIADTFNFRVKVIKDLEGDGTPSAMFGDYGNSVGQFNRVVDVGPDDQGNILTMDVGSQTSQAFDLEGNFKYVLASEDGTEQIPAAGPVAFTRLGKRIYIVNNMSGFIYIFELLDEIGPPVKKK